MSNGMFTVMGFTIRNKLKNKSFLITSIIIAVLMSIVANLPYIISKFQSDEATGVGVISADRVELVQKLEIFYNNQENQDIALKVYQDQGSKEANDKYLKDRISDGEIKGYIEFGASEENGFPKVVYKSKDTMDFGFTNKLQAGIQYVKTEEVAKDLLTMEQLATILAPVKIETMQISTTEGGVGTVSQEGKTEKETGIATIMAFIMLFMLFMGIMITGQLIATEITAEKSSRIMEVLVTSVSPIKQMFGKIIGMLVVGLSQILLLVGVGVINLSLPHNRGALESLDISFSDINPNLMVYAIVFYLLGYFLYATLYAAVGSLVSRTEELGQAVMPLTFLSMAGFYIAYYGVYQPNGAFIKAMSFVPLFSPFVMYLRIGLVDPAAWEVALSIGLLIVTTLFMGWLSAKIYRTGVLMYGKRPSIKELRKAMKAYKV